MLNVIKFIKTPLDKYSAHHKKKISQIKSLSGSGKIHSAIIDIDFFNHIYVNPNDLCITPYYALDMVQKFVFKNIPSLLKKNVTQLYERYLNRIASNSKSTASNDLLKNLELNTSTDFILVLIFISRHAK